MRSPLIALRIPRTFPIPTKRICAFALYLLIGWTYSSYFWLGEVPIVNLWVNAVIEKPYTYRQLVPLATKALITLTSLPMDLAFVIVVSISFVAAVVMVGKFLQELGDEQRDLHEILIAMFLGIARLHYANPYDFTTLATFSWCLVLLHRRQFWLYQVVFFVACINRETTYLLTIFFTLYFFQALFRRTYLLHILAQLGSFFVIRLVMLYAFRENTGVVAQFNFFLNLREFVTYPLATAATVAVFVGVGWLILARWHKMPIIVQTVLLAFTPPLVIMWLLLGRSFELRVFMELLPALAAVILLNTQISLPLPVTKDSTLLLRP